MTKQEEYKLKQDLRNKTKLHESARERVKKLEAIVKAQTEEITELKRLRTEDRELILELKRQLEELRAKIFKKPKKQSHPLDEEDNDADIPEKEPRRHSTRPIPPPESITSTKEYHFSKRQQETQQHCTHCTQPLSSYQTTDYYTEDIVLPHEQQLTTVEKTSIARGWCRSCRRWSYAKAPPSAPVVFGEKVKIYICYLSILLRLSYAQIRLHLATSYHMTVSDGEISHILAQEAVKLRPEYEALHRRINQQRGVHEDETGWPVQAEEHGNYGWVKTGTETNEAVFRFGESRGKGVAESLTGDFTGVGITDDYAVYQGIFKEKHQLCWAHPLRKLRDLAQSGVFDEETTAHCKAVYKEFSVIYSFLRDTLAQSWDAAKNKRVRRQILKKLNAFAQPNNADPVALANIRKRLTVTAEKYVTCLLYEGIPPDNNKAERALRHMVIKRKISFGSRTQKGAEVLSVLASVILSLYWTKPESFFSELVGLRVV